MEINSIINGMPLAFLEVKKTNNEGGIQKEFDHMISEILRENMELASLRDFLLPMLMNGQVTFKQ
jgi:hypothetical protein